ncbi:predicted protein [Clavispora lusitaniae ATCC 42720]|uniref:Secreted protein n=1 Tax=Clavispora lusitaniae (strain ATCC 42720) TaxID=306902 RepID=C4Y1G6_CLAL4|nr:uncharacterized protein CLUG_02048 [Clavispora lusitaniae ATCC 42720]EEQ37925.1 predicted protein [Clavispora lusitaniae ATCC 42720]
MQTHLIVVAIPFVICSFRCMRRCSAFAKPKWPVRSVEMRLPGALQLRSSPILPQPLCICNEVPARSLPPNAIGSAIRHFICGISHLSRHAFKLHTPKAKCLRFCSILPVPSTCYGQLERASTHSQTATLKIPIYFLWSAEDMNRWLFSCVCRISDCASAHVCRLYVLHEQIQTNFGKT